MPVDDLQRDARNPKAHVGDDIGASMRRFGYTEPILLDERTGLLISGHGRLDELDRAMKAKETAPDGIVVDGKKWLAPVTRGWSSADDDEAEAYLIAANELTTRGGWNFEMLAESLGRLHTKPGGLTGVGFTAQEASDLLASYGPRGNLDDLASRIGPPTAEDFWPILRIKVSPELKGRYEALVAHLGPDETERFAWLVTTIEEHAKA
jgi:hypothetical protein